MGSSVRAAQAYKEKENLSKKRKQTEITYWEVLPGDRIGVSSMIGASKLISKYRKFFNPKDIDFLLNRKKYSGEQTEIRPIKKFYLNREDQDLRIFYYTDNFIMLNESNNRIPIYDQTQETLKNSHL